jgi:DNA-binding response OmpR family regulator
MRHRSRILIVDDDPSEKELVEATAAASGAESVWCENGEDGLTRASSEPFDAILLDILLPDQNGYEICRKLKSNPDTVGVPLLFVTARNEEADILPGFEALAFDFLFKPFHARELRARIGNALRQKALRDELASLSRFYESCISIWRALDDARGPETARRIVLRELEKIAAAFEADGVSFSLDHHADFLACGVRAGVPPVEIPVAEEGVAGVFRLYRSSPCDPDEKLRLADLASTLGRGIRRLLPPGAAAAPLALD